MQNLSLQNVLCKASLGPRYILDFGCYKSNSAYLWLLKMNKTSGNNTSLYSRISMINTINQNKM